MRRTLRNWGAPGGCTRPPRCRSHSRAWSVHSSSPPLLSLGCLTPTVWQYQKWLSSLHNAVNHRHGLKSYTPLTAAPVTSKKKKKKDLVYFADKFSFLSFFFLTDAALGKMVRMCIFYSGLYQVERFKNSRSLTAGVRWGHDMWKKSIRSSLSLFVSSTIIEPPSSFTL